MASFGSPLRRALKPRTTGSPLPNPHSQRFQNFSGEPVPTTTKSINDNDCQEQVVPEPAQQVEEVEGSTTSPVLPSEYQSTTVSPDKLSMSLSQRAILREQTRRSRSRTPPGARSRTTGAAESRFPINGKPVAPKQSSTATCLRIPPGKPIPTARKCINDNDPKKPVAQKCGQQVEGSAISVESPSAAQSTAAFPDESEKPLGQRAVVREQTQSSGSRTPASDVWTLVTSGQSSTTDVNSLRLQPDNRAFAEQSVATSSTLSLAALDVGFAAPKFVTNEKIAAIRARVQNRRQIQARGEVRDLVESEVRPGAKPCAFKYRSQQEHSSGTGFCVGFRM